MEVKTLFRIEAIGKTQIKVTRSDYLRSLPHDEQIRVLTSYLKMLNEQISTREFIGLTEKELEMQITITEGLLSELKKRHLKH